MQPTFWPDQIDAHSLLVHVAAGRATANYANNQKIYRQGEEARFVFFVQEGSVELTVTSEQGVSTLLGVAGEGQFFGEACLLDEPVRVATATALGDCRITSITKAAILSVINENPRFAKLFIAYLADHNSWVHKYMLHHPINLKKMA